MDSLSQQKRHLNAPSEIERNTRGKRKKRGETRGQKIADGSLSFGMGSEKPICVTKW